MKPREARSSRSNNLVFGSNQSATKQSGGTSEAYGLIDKKQKELQGILMGVLNVS
jgi:hypothetical protein